MTMVQENSDLIVSIGTNLGWLIAAGLSGLVMYWKTKPPKPQDPVVTGVGLELGTRMQMEQLIEQVERCADSLEKLADQRQDDMRVAMEELLERLRRAEMAR